MVSRQLERNDIHPFKVERRCGSGFPTVIRCAPLGGPGSARVFTTLYWLTCPEMLRHIGRLESEGWIGRLEKAAGADPEMAESLKDLHGEYAYVRRRLAGRRRLMRLRETSPRMAEAIEETGIAGVAAARSGANIKCLHAHAAYHLVHGGHPLFLSFPELVKNLDGCRSCEKLCGTADRRTDKAA